MHNCIHTHTHRALAQFAYEHIWLVTTNPDPNCNPKLYPELTTLTKYYCDKE